jgi:hypothetical protein
MHRHRGAGGPDRLAQECRFALIGFHQVKGESRHDRENEAWEARAGSKIDRAACARGDQRDKLEGIRDVARPKIGLITTGDQIDGAIPPEQQRRELRQGLPRFT